MRSLIGELVQTTSISAVTSTPGVSIVTVTRPSFVSVFVTCEPQKILPPERTTASAIAER